MLKSIKEINTTIKHIIKMLIENQDKLSDVDLTYKGKTIFYDIKLSIYYSDRKNSKLSDILDTEKFIKFINNNKLDVDKFEVSFKNNYWLDCYANIVDDNFELIISFELSLSKMNFIKRLVKLNSLEH